MHNSGDLCKMEGMNSRKIAFNKVVLEDFFIFAF